MNLFLTPESTFTTGLRWSEQHKTFVRCEPAEGEGVIFEIATPTDEQLSRHWGALQGIPARGSALDYSELHGLLWGPKERPGLVRKILPAQKGTIHNALSLAIARVIREELGLEKRLEDDKSEAGIDAEGNSASPSGSGSAS